jgi:hypothetical protein
MVLGHGSSQFRAGLATRSGTPPESAQKSPPLHPEGEYDITLIHEGMTVCCRVWPAMTILALRAEASFADLFVGRGGRDFGFVFDGPCDASARIGLWTA